MEEGSPGVFLKTYSSIKQVRVGDECAPVCNMDDQPSPSLMEHVMSESEHGPVPNSTFGAESFRDKLMNKVSLEKNVGIDISSLDADYDDLNDEEDVLISNGEHGPSIQFSNRAMDRLYLTKPLEAFVQINQNWYNTEYEGLPDICYHYGRYGHRRENCELRVKVPAYVNTESTVRDDLDKMKTGSAGASVNDPLADSGLRGPWMNVQSRRQPKPDFKASSDKSNFNSSFLPDVEHGNKMWTKTKNAKPVFRSALNDISNKPFEGKGPGDMSFRKGGGPSKMSSGKANSIKILAVDHFSNLFSTTSLGDYVIDLHNLFPPVDVVDLHGLVQPINMTEVKTSLFNIGGLKAPGVDGFPTCFYQKKESRVVLSVKMVSQHQSKDSGSKKNGGKELGMVAPQDKSSKEMKSSKKMKFASSSAETEPTSQTTISDDSKTGRGMSTMPSVVKRKLQKLRPIVEYNKRGKGIGQAHSEMQSYIGVLAHSRVPLVDKKWSQIPKDIKEQIWEAVDMAFVVGQGGKNSVLASAVKKWKDFKSTLTRHYILPYTNDKEKLSQPPETYKFIEKAQWDAFVASRLSKDFESVHSQHAQIREKLEYNHRLSRKGYAGLEDQLEETMPGVEIDRSTLWKRARQDKHGNIPDPKVAEKAKLIDELQKQVSEGKVSVYGSNDVLTMALGPEHPGRLRGVGAGISPRQYFNLPKPQRVSFDDCLKESLKALLQEETKKMEAKAREEALRMEARTKQLVEVEREHFLSQLSQLIPNFDPSMLKTRISQSPKNPMSDKASCSGGDVRSLHFEDDTAKMGKHQEDEEKEEEKKDEEKEEEKQEEKEKEDKEKHDDKVIEVGDYSNMEAPSSLKTLCRYVEMTLLPEDKIL
ncbi:hypothetical protein L3X38_027269 [Prunus dulcis]|uniref:Uncharacterized protein n=1 Tax=Prunus dulcis TaxID=3755 RepID=A0AAD4VMQ7_PRUDU|nr:hypothetical protein L3X38_027269 [Prunus dulcis]